MRRSRFFRVMLFNSLVRRRSRIVVAVSALAVGTALLSGLLAVYADIPRQMGLEFRSYGANLLLFPFGDSPTLDDGDLEKALALFPPEAVRGVVPLLYGVATVNRHSLSLAGTDFEQARRVSPYWQVSGAWPEKGSSGVLVGAEIAETLGLKTGQTISLVKPHEKAGVAVKVEGILKTGKNEESFIFADLGLVRGMLGESGKISLAQMSVLADREKLEAYGASIRREVPSLLPRVVKQIAQSEAQVLEKLKTLIYLVSFVVLTLTLICVATTMIAIVTERRSEIGLKKALGAKNRRVIGEFMGEGLVLGGIGGILGTGLGFAFARILGLSVFGREIALEPISASFAFFCAIALAALACLLPVKMASEVEPAVVLRGE